MLPADAWLIDYTRTLDCSIGGGPMIWRSPLWMPLAWQVVAVQFGYIGLRLWERFGKVGLLILGLLGWIEDPQIILIVHHYALDADKMRTREARRVLLVVRKRFRLPADELCDRNGVIIRPVREIHKDSAGPRRDTHAGQLFVGEGGYFL